MSSFTKAEITGTGALAALQRIACNDLDRGPGSFVYTQFLNARGGIEVDLTITRLDEDRFYVVTGSAYRPHDLAHLQAHLPRDGSVMLRDVTAQFAVINLVGPLSREVLSRVSTDDVSAVGIPYMQAREIQIGYAVVRALRVSYVGEPGWELHVQVEYARHVCDRLIAASAALRIIDVGYRAILSLRLKKQYLYWGVDISPDDTPLEAGLGFCMAWTKASEFIGRAALARQREAGVARKLTWFNIVGEAPWSGGEPILHHGRVVGTVTSAGFGYAIGRTIAPGYLPASLGDEEGFEIEAIGEQYAVSRHTRAIYDPAGARLRS